MSETAPPRRPRAFSSEVGTGSREENASEQEARASVPIQSEWKGLWDHYGAEHVQIFDEEIQRHRFPAAMEG